MPKLNENYLKSRRQAISFLRLHTVRLHIQRAESGGGCEDHPSGNRRCDASA